MNIRVIINPSLISLRSFLNSYFLKQNLQHQTSDTVNDEISAFYRNLQKLKIVIIFEKDMKMTLYLHRNYIYINKENIF